MAVTASDHITAALAATGPDAGFDAVVRAEVGAVLDQPHYTRTLMLERHRIAIDHPEVSGAEASNMAIAGAALRRLNPALDDRLVGFRLFTSWARSPCSPRASRSPAAASRTSPPARSWPSARPGPYCPCPGASTVTGRAGTRG